MPHSSGSDTSETPLYCRYGPRNASVRIEQFETLLPVRFLQSLKAWCAVKSRIHPVYSL
jgi:hypothetical protein